MVEKIRVGLAGTGFGARVQAPGFLDSGEFEIAAVWSRTPERARKTAERYGVPRVCSSWDELAALPELEAISVVTPPAFHYPAVMTALRAGKHVLCEKPFAMDTAQAVEMTHTARQLGLVGMIDHEFRFAPGRAYVKALIEDGYIGTPYLINIAGASSLMAEPGQYQQPWFGDRAAGAGWLGVSGSHMVDLVRFWCGDFAEVSASLTAFSHLPDTDPAELPEDSFTLQFRLNGGVEGVIQQTAAAWGERFIRMQITGSRGTLVLLDERAELYGARTGHRGALEPLAIPPEFQRAAPRPELKARGGSSHLEIPAFTVLAGAFAGAIRGEGPPSPSFEDGLRCQEVMDVTRQAHAERRWLPVPRNNIA